MIKSPWFKVFMGKRKPKEEPVKGRHQFFVIPDGWSVVINSWGKDGPIHHELWDADKWNLTYKYYQDICKQERVIQVQVLLFKISSSPPTQDREMRESILLEHYEE